ncbi:MAG: MAPEG family protein [Microcoleaceae cyanobacterium]
MLFGLSTSAIVLSAIAIAAALIYLPFLVVGFARLQVGYDTQAPRAMFDRLPAYAQRATWAHQNAFETFMPFTAAALMAYVTGQTSQLVVGSAIAFVVARAFYPIFYILNVPLARSLMFGIGSISTVILFAVSLLSLNNIS